MDEKKKVLFFSVVEASFHNELNAKFQYLDSLVKGNRSNHPSFIKIFSISYYLVENNQVVFKNIAAGHTKYSSE